MEHRSYEERLRDLQLFKMEETKRGSYQCIEMSYGLESTGWSQTLFSGASDKTRGTGHKLEHCKFRMK